MSRRHDFPPDPPIPSAAMRVDPVRTIKRRAQDEQRCRCGKVTAYSEDEAHEMVAAIARHTGKMRPVWFYQHGRAWHWSQLEHHGVPGWTPTP